MSRSDRFLNACHRRPVDATPIWLMRQAGRYMPEYRKIREQHSLLDMIRTPDLAAEVTLQPVRAFDVDAAIIFSDILPPLEELGLDLEFVSGTGPVILNPVRSAADVDRLSPRPGRGRLETTVEAIRLVVKELDGLVPLIGFAAAPYTLACYGIEGGSSRDFRRAKQFMYAEPEAWHRFLGLLADVLLAYLRDQVSGGAQAIQVFDSWAGSLSPIDYRTYALPHAKRLLNGLRDLAVPVIYFGTGMSGLLGDLKGLPADVIGIDWRLAVSEAHRQLGPEKAIQGNLDPFVLMAPVNEIDRQVRALLRDARGLPGHIFNLGHGIHKETPVEHVTALVHFVHEKSTAADG